MRSFKKLIASISSLVMCLSLVPVGASADENVISLQEQFDEIQSSNPNYIEFKCFDLENNTNSTISVDDSLDGLEEYMISQENLGSFISTLSISSSGLIQTPASEVTNKVGWITVSNNLNSSYNDCGMNGTAFLIAPDIVLTAGHCVHIDNNENGYFNTMYFEAGRYGGASVCRSKVAKVFIPEDYFNNDGSFNSEKDFAVLKLSSSIGNYPNVGYEEIAIPTTALEGINVTLKGYPQINANPELEYQFYSTGTLTSVETNRIYYNATTANGMSGSPVYNCNSSNVIGIHSGKDGVIGRGTKITGAIYRFTMLDFDTAINLP